MFEALKARGRALANGKARRAGAGGGKAAVSFAARLTFDGVSRHYGETLALDHVSLDIALIYAVKRIRRNPEQLSTETSPDPRKAKWRRELRPVSCSPTIEARHRGISASDDQDHAARQIPSPQ